LKERFDKYEQYKLTEDSIFQMIKGQTDKNTSDKGETDDMRQDTVFHDE
jgi:hypothetical protein